MTQEAIIQMPSKGSIGHEIDVDNLIEDRVGEGIFRVRREIYTDQQVFDLEMMHIFEGTWLFLGLESQIAQPNDFITVYMGRQPVLLSRSNSGKIGAFLNTCRHRGALVCPQKHGNARAHVCRYHGWTYDSSGNNLGVSQIKDGQYPQAFHDEDHNLTPIARLENYRGFIFGSLSPDVPSLEEHLGDAIKFLDLIADQSPQGMECIPGEVNYTFDGNWKLQFENGIDYYHFATTHSSYVDVLQERYRTGAVPTPQSYEKEEIEDTVGSYTFAHGHAVVYAVGKKKYLQVKPLAEEPGVMDEIRGRVGDTRAKWMLRQRNLTIFPNLQIIDISSLQIRTWRPLGPGKTQMTSHCIAPIGEGDEARALRIRNYEDFFNPSGLATSDDNLMYEYLQCGHGAKSAAPLQGYFRGLGAPLSESDPFVKELEIAPQTWAYGPVTFGDETCFHAGYREWLRLIKRGIDRKRGSNT